MPYTPPSSRSPATSAPSSPDISRRPSFHHSPTSSSRPVLPRSASYMTKHRRTPSAPTVPRHHGEPSPESTSEDLHGMIANTSVRQSPPPVTGDRRMPNGAIISPPDSSSDDDELPEVRLQSRGRPVEPTLLHHAMIQIPQHRSSSPTTSGAKERQSSLTVDVLAPPSQTNGEGMRHSLSDGSLVDLVAGGNRKVSHTRSATEPKILVPQSSEVSLTGSSVTASDEETDDDMMRKPQMVRKKSGELVRPALRGSSRRRPSSVPGTPTFSKAVHFDSHLEHVRHFLQVDRPLAVSAGTSPAETYESDTEYPFSGDDRSTARSPPFEWEIVMNNFPVDTPYRRAQVVRLERVWLSTDQQSLIGSVAVANLAFQKSVTCRFTLDYWKTTSEVAAEYVCEILPAETPVSHDRFNFNIKLSDLANLESKTLYFCIRYNVNGQEHWDNNNGMNFQADFRKKNLPQNGKRPIGAASRPVNGLPKSNRRSNPSAAPRPKSMPAGSNEFGAIAKLTLDQSIEDYLGDSDKGSARLKGVKSSGSLPTDDLSTRLAAPSGKAFKGRYDFGASLTAALQTAKDQDDLYMKPHKRTVSPHVPVTKSPNSSPVAGVSSIPKTMASAGQAPASASGAPTIATASYDEIINKFCFYGTKSGTRLDGADGSIKSPTGSQNSSYEGSPVQMVNYHHTHSGTQHHSLHNGSPASYFQYPNVFVPVGASPSDSPMACFSPQQLASPLTGPSWAPPPPLQGAGRSSPVSSVNAMAQLNGTSSIPYRHQQSPERFPFAGGEGHSATAIRG
ncbi:putative phosphatase regulatory subunit-domain-containing protein [Podospora conica]|nr:putative phosphatase regulatory subunit-domain-containing protein [Schizothecium conicum]